MDPLSGACPVARNIRPLNLGVYLSRQRARGGIRTRVEPATLPETSRLHVLDRLMPVVDQRRERARSASTRERSDFALDSARSQLRTASVAAPLLARGVRLSVSRAARRPASAAATAFLARVTATSWFDRKIPANQITSFVCGAMAGAITTTYIIAQNDDLRNSD